MKKIHLYIAIFIAISSFWACEIERKPFQDLEDEQVFSDELGIEAAALGTYALLKENSFMRPYHFHGEYGGDNIALSGSTTDALYYMYNFQHTVNNGHLNSLWVTSYKGIINSNKVIENAARGTSDKMDHIIGEMYYLRGFFYFTMVNIWGRPYTQAPTSNLGVPLILDAEPDENNLPPRATVAEVYAQIEADLKMAAELMGNYDRPAEELRIFASIESAWALLSRVYLYMENDTEAAAYATDVIESGKFGLLQGDAFTKYPTYVPEENSETIFACRSLEDEDNYGWMAIGGMYANIDGVGWGEMYASQPYRDLVGQYPEDLRNSFIEPQYVEHGDADAFGNPYNFITYVTDKDEPAGSKMFTTAYAWYEEGIWYYYDGASWPTVETEAGVDGKATKYFIYIDGVKTYVEPGAEMEVRNGYPKYYVTKCSNQGGQPQLWSPVISRLAEMYLNRAEANAKTGNESAALEDINVIRQRAGIPTYDAVPAGRTALELVLEERQLELAFESHRRYDIFRNGLTLDRTYPGTHDRGNAILTIPANHNRVIDFIPETQILAQPNLVQNP
ncbi:MAG: RagB/SusD family nutrient uptake outer membrane protein [Bacteroidota bacterium]